MRANTVAEVQGNLSQDFTPCIISPRAAGHVANALSTMYGDKAKAVLREYAANARDSHVQAGVTRPIEITLPSEMNPLLVIRDFGVGLSRVEMVETYAAYGATTKQDDDEQIGHYGFGAKAAFSVGSQFTVTGVKDGERTVMLFALDANGFPGFMVLAHGATEQGNGVVVQVGVVECDPMVTAAAALFGTWEPGSVLVDGEVPASAYRDTLEIAGGMHASWTRGHHEGSLTLVMGGIGYEASADMLIQAARRQDRSTQEVLRLVQQGLQLWAEVPIGSVDITPSREGLRDTPRTLMVLAGVAQTYAESIVSALTATLDAEPTALEASIRVHELRGLVPGFTRNGIVWRGRRLDYKVILPLPALTLEVNRKGVGRISSAPTYVVHLGESVDRLLVVTGVDAGVRRLANRYLSANSEVGVLLLADTDRGSQDWFAWGGRSPVRTITAAEFKAQAKLLPATPRAQSRMTYRVYLDGETSTRASDEVGQHEGRILGVTGNCPDSLLASALKPDDLVVLLTGSQTLNGLARRVPGDLTDAHDLRKAAALDALSKANDMDLAIALGLRKTDSTLHVLASVADRLTYPGLREAVEADTALRQALSVVGSSDRDLLSAAMRHLPQETVNSLKASLATPPVPDYVSLFPLLGVTVNHMRSYCGMSASQRRPLVEHLVPYLNNALAPAAEQPAEA